MKTLLEEYTHYVASVYSGPISPVQRAELEKAFMAGALNMLHKVLHLPADEDAAIAALEVLEKEIQDYPGQLLKAKQ